MTTLSTLEELASYVPALILRRMTGDSVATLTPSIERFPAAVLFADLSGFTALTEYLTQQNPAGAEELTRILDLYFGHLVQVVGAHGGDVVKFAGDGLLALWYGDEPLPQLAQRAVQCGLAVQMMMAPEVWGSFDGYLPSAGLKVRVGVAAGEVTTMHLGGVFGRWELLVTGDALRQASLAEAQARPGEVLIAADTWPLVREGCAGTPLPSGAVRLDTLIDYLPMRALEPPPLHPIMSDTLRAYLPKAILNRVDAGQTAWLAEQRRVTVLFINLPDLQAGTPLGQAQALMRTLQAMLYRYEGSISRLGTDNKGPTLVAAMGLPPLSHEDDAERGMQAALAIAGALRELEFSCSIGVTTGQALCGAVGAHNRREYTMMGSIVNRSARLMQAAAEVARSGGSPILCDMATYRAARDQVAFEALAPIALKGVSEPVPVYRPSAAPPAAQADPAEPEQSADTLIGREREQALFAELLAGLTGAGRGGALLIEGEAGIGKSRLLRQFAADARESGVCTLVGAASPVERAPYFAWRGVFRTLLSLLSSISLTPPPLPPREVQGRIEHLSDGGYRGVGANDSPSPPVPPSREREQGDAPQGDVANGDLAPQARPPLHPLGAGEAGRSAPEGGGVAEGPTADQLAAWLGPELGRLAPLLGAVLALDLPDNPLTAQMVGQVRADNTRALLVQLLARAAAQRSLLLVFDDLQWLDAGSWALLAAAAAQVQPLLLVTASRPMVETPEEYQRLVYQPDARRLQLRGLDPAAIERLLAHRLGVPAVPAEVSQLITQRAQGNPFFSEELLHALRDQRLLVVEAGGCRLVAASADPAQILAALRLPETVQGLITSRIDRLSPAQQLTLKVAGVIGPVFALNTLSAIHPVERDAERLVDQLFALQQVGLVAIESFEPELIYAFKPAAACEVAYNLMSYGQRRRLHRALAELLEQSPHEPGQANNLARHWQSADEPLRAMPYLALAGEAALRGGAYREAVAALSEALAITTAHAGDAEPAPDRLTLARWERQLGEAYHAMGRLIESRELLERAVARLGFAVPRRREEAALALAGELLRQARRRLWPPARPAQAAAPALLEGARAYGTLTQLAYYDSQLLPALHAALRGLNLAEQAGLSPELAGGYASTQVALGVLPPLARHYQRLAQRAAVQLDHLPTLVWVAESQGLYALGHTDWRRAEAALRYAIAIAERLGDHRRRAECRALLCLVQSHRGDVRGALAGCVELQAEGRRHGDTQVRTWGLVGAAENFLTLGDHQQAGALLGEAEGLLAEYFGSARAEEIWTYALMARAALLKGDLEVAHALAGVAGRLIGQVPPAAIYALSGYSALAEVSLLLWERSHGADRRSLAQRARQACAALGRFALIFPVARPATLTWGGLYAQHAGHPRAARRLWHQAIEQARRRGMPYAAARAHHELGRHSTGEERRAHLARAEALLAQVRATR